MPETSQGIAECAGAGAKQHRAFAIFAVTCRHAAEGDVTSKCTLSCLTRAIVLLGMGSVCAQDRRSNPHCT